MGNATVKVVDQSFTILPPGQDPTERVAQMARLCYRSESDGTSESNNRLVKNCIKRGHTSVCEHGWIEIYISPIKKITKEDFDELGEGSITPKQIWSQFMSDDKSKYVLHASDPSLCTRVPEIADISVDQSKNLPASAAEQLRLSLSVVDVANFRTWTKILSGFLMSAMQQQTVLCAIFTMAMIKAFHDEFPVVFDELYSCVTKALSAAKKEHWLWKLVRDEKCERTDALTIEEFAPLMDKFGFFVAKAPDQFTLSAIIKTSRQMTHQLVRHRRDVAYSQESQRYVNYGGKGFEVICPMLDPVKCKDYRFLTAANEWLQLNKNGLLPEKSLKYQLWLKTQECACLDYLDLIADDGTMIKIVHSDGGDDKEKVGLPPETARGDLTNDFATTIGVTWTPECFQNLAYWRLEEHAQWPIRRMISEIILEGLQKHHPFFDNFPPKLVTTWIEQIYKNGVCTKEEADKLLLNEKTREQILIKRLREAMQALNKQQSEPEKK